MHFAPFLGVSGLGIIIFFYILLFLNNEVSIWNVDHSKTYFFLGLSLKISISIFWQGVLAKANRNFSEKPANHTEKVFMLEWNLFGDVHRGFDNFV